MKQNKTLEEDYRTIAWNYFKLHANQRIYLFRFYIIFFSLFSLVIGHLISEFHFLSIYQELIVIVLSLVFLCITIIFWCLDARNRYLIHNAEKYFVDYEDAFSDKKIQIKIDSDKNRFLNTINSAKIFTKEECDTRDGKCLFRHTCCFRFIFSIGILLSIIFIAFSGYSMSHHEDNIYHQIKILNTERQNLQLNNTLFYQTNQFPDIMNSP